MEVDPSEEGSLGGEIVAKFGPRLEFGRDSHLCLPQPAQEMPINHSAWQFSAIVLGPSELRMWMHGDRA